MAVLFDLGLEAQRNRDVQKGGWPPSLKADCRHQLRLHCWVCSQCLCLGPDADGPSVREQAEACGVNLPVCTKAVDPATSSWSACVNCVDPIEVVILLS